LCGMAGKRKQRPCRICRKRPPWQYKNCPPGICKRCYHRHVWADRSAAHQHGPTGSAATDALWTGDGLATGWLATGSS